VRKGIGGAASKNFADDAEPILNTEYLATFDTRLAGGVRKPKRP